jgi:putative membrane protein
MILLYIVAARYLTLVFAVWLAAELVRGVEVVSQTTLLVVAFLLGLFNLTIKPILFLLTLPLTIATYGLFALVLNATLLWFIASFTEGFTITHFFAAVLASLIISLVSTASWWLLQWWGKCAAQQAIDRLHWWV